MNDDIEKLILDETSNNFSLISLFFQADIVVKTVIVILIFASIWSWTIIFSKFSELKNVIKASDDFEDNFYASETLQKLSRKLSGHPSHPMEAIFYAAMNSLHKVKLSLISKNQEYKDKLCERIEKEMIIVSERELISLNKNMNFLASVGSTAPFIGLFGTVWGIMNSFTAIGVSQNTSLAVVAPGIAEALFATALGLVAAIPAVLAFNKLNDLIDSFGNRMSLFTDEMIIIISKEVYK
tara:strand:- start:426 stop:1142 length:717 start_codon:yes stop_codon:yes gene_type:complete